MHVQYRTDVWLSADDGRVYVKVEAIEFERATDKTFELAGKRRLWRFAEAHGAAPDFAKGMGSVEVWDRALDYASDLVVAYTYRSRDPLVVVTDEALADA